MMFKNTFFSVLFILSIFGIKAQNLQVLIDPINPSQTHSLFNLTLINSSSSSRSVTLIAELNDVEGNLLLRQNLVTTINGIETKGIRGASLNFDQDFIDSQFSKLYSSNSILPPLNYILCITSNINGDLSNSNKECIEIIPSDLVNIYPIYPQDGQIINENRPLISWIDLNLNKNIDYSLVIVEKGKNQSNNKALRRNNPIVLIDGINSNSLYYPADAIPLKNGKEYAWQLNIQHNGNKTALTQPWSFTYIEGDSIDNFPLDISFVDIQRISDGIELYALGEFKFKYTASSAKTFDVKLFKKNKKEWKEIELETKKIKIIKGVNNVRFDLKDQIYLLHKKKYKLILENNEERFSLNLIYLNPEYAH